MKFSAAALVVIAALTAANASARTSGATTRVSVSSSGQQGDRPSYPEGISAGGRYVALTSEATNLVPHDTNGRRDAFVHDRKTGRTTRVSVSSSGKQAKPGADGFGGSTADGISADGRYVVFDSDASNLVPGDTNRVVDIFVRDRKTGRTIRVSVGSKGRQGNGSSGFATISADRRYVAFSSMASNLVPGDTNRISDVFVRDLVAGTTRRISVTSDGSQAKCSISSCESTEPALSAHGRYVAFQSSATNLVPRDTNRLADVFWHDMRTGETRRVSVSSSGGQGAHDSTRNGSNAPAISADGRYVAFHSADSNLVRGDTNRTFDIFVYDRATRQTQRVSVGDHGQQANGENLGALTISANGRYVAFSSLASNLVPGDKNDITDVFVRDLRKNRTTLVSLSSGGTQGDDGSWIAGGLSFTADNRMLAFASWAKNLVPGDTNRSPDAFVRTLGNATGLAAASHAKPLLVHQEPRGIANLVVTGDRVEVVYTVDSHGVHSLKGSFYVRNDLRTRFVRVPLRLQGNPGSPTLAATVPARLIHGHKLWYYAVVRDSTSGRSATVPAGGARAAKSAWILERPVVVRLGTHRFGQTRAPDAIVARAGASEVGFENNDQYQFGPQTFLVGQDGSVWLHDGLKQRLLVWQAGHPGAFARSLPLPFFAGDNDVALGPGGSVYVTQALAHPARLVLDRVDANGQVLWQTQLAGEYAGNSTFGLGSNSALRFGPDGTLYCLVWMGALPGGELGWMPVATPDGRPLSASAQRQGTRWPGHPVAGGLRLVSETYTPPNAEAAPHDARFALIDRHGRVVRAWRVVSRTDINLDSFTSQLAGGDPVVVLDVATKGYSKFEYQVLRLGPRGARARFSLSPGVWGDHVLADLRLGPDNNLYQLATSPISGIVIGRYSLTGGQQ